MKHNNNVFVAHIRDAINQIINYAKTHTYQQFLDSPWDQAAVTRHLEIIGEAASQVTDDFKKTQPQIPWRKISAFRNVLIHEYFAVDPLLVWEILQKDIPKLLVDIENLLSSV